MCAELAAVNAAMAYDVVSGLLSIPKRLSPKYFYDARGSELFEEITRLPEYYLTRTELGIFQKHAREMLKTAGANLTLLELGAGSAAKTVTLLQELQQSQENPRYYPIDVSHSALQDAVASLSRLVPSVRVEPLVLDYTEGLDRIHSIEGQKLVLYIGSSIGNFEPFHAGAVLKKVRHALRPGDALLLGTDMRKDESILLPAYDDERGITAEFNKNVLAHINRELNADFDLNRFAHLALWNCEQSRMEMYLKSLRSQKVRIGVSDTVISFGPGELIHTENSYKFTIPMIESIAHNGGFTIERTWTDAKGWFTVHLLRA